MLAESLQFKLTLSTIPGAVLQLSSIELNFPLETTLNDGGLNTFQVELTG